MRVVERGEQLDVAREQHPVPEDVARHVSDPHDREVVLLNIGAELAEVTLDRLPCAPRSDSHLLVVVALRASGGERVVQPESVLLGDLVGDVRELRGPLVRGDDQVGVVSVVANHSVGVDDVVSDDVVGHVQQPGEKHAEARDGFLSQRLSALRGTLEDEPAL